MFNFTKFFYQMTFEQKNIFLKVTRKIDLSWKKKYRTRWNISIPIFISNIRKKKKQLNKCTTCIVQRVNVKWITWTIQPSLENDKNSRVLFVKIQKSIVEVTRNRIGKDWPGNWIPSAKLVKFTFRFAKSCIY